MKSNFKTILVPVDFTEYSDIALNQGIKLAKLYDLEMIILHVGNFKSSAFSFFSKPQVNKEEYKKESLHKLKKIADDYSKVSGVKIVPMYEEGNYFKITARFGELFFAKYIVMSLPDQDLKHKENVVKEILEYTKICKSNVIFIPGKKNIDTLKNVLLPLDLTKESRQKISVALDYSKRYNTKIDLYSFIEGDEFAVVKLKSQIEAVVKFLVANNAEYTTTLTSAADGVSNLVDGLINYSQKNHVDAIMIMINQDKGNKHTQELLIKTNLPVIAVASRAINSIVKF